MTAAATGPMMSTVFAVTVYAVAVVVIYRGSTWLFRALIRARHSGGCRLCAYFGQLPSGPPYWVLRWHLARTGQRMRTSDREPQV